MDEHARVQENEMVGTVALDYGDFDHYAALLGIDDWTVLRLDLGATHPDLFGNSATSSFTSLNAWAVHRSEVAEAGGVPTLIDSQRPVYVTEFSLTQAADIEYESPANAIALLLRGAKRIQIDLWAHWIQDAGLNIGDFQIIKKFSLEWSGTEWTSLEERLG